MIPGHRHILRVTLCDEPPGELMLAKMRGAPCRHIPFATYNLHPYGDHAADPSYTGLLKTVQNNPRAGMRARGRLEKRPREGAAAGLLDLNDIDRGLVQRRRAAPGDLMTTTQESNGELRITRELRTPRGILRAVDIKPRDQPTYSVEPFVKDDADIARVLSLPPGPGASFDATAVRELIARLGGRGTVCIPYPDPLYCAYTLFDIGDFSERCVTGPELLDELIRHFAEAAYAEVDAMARACAGLPVEFSSGGPEVATPPLMGPGLFTRFVTPYQKKIAGILHGHGLLAGIHCHGRVRQVLDDLIEIGIDTLEPIEPPGQGDVTLRELLAKVAGRICLMGYIQDQDFYRAAPGGMRERVREVAQTVTPGDRYIMMPTCTPFQSPLSARYEAAYAEWMEAAAELLP